MALAASSPAIAAEIGAKADFFMLLQKKDVPGFASQSSAPFIQSLNLNAKNLGYKNLDFYASGYAREPLGDDSLKGPDNGQLTYGYLQLKSPTGSYQVKAGRLFFSEGVASGQIDGAIGSVVLTDGFAVTGFAGAPVKLAGTDEKAGNVSYGGRFSWTNPCLTEIGISGLKESGGAPHTDRALVGGDLWQKIGSGATFSAKGSYNTNTSSVAEASAMLSERISPKFSFSLGFNKIDAAGYFVPYGSSAIFDPMKIGNQTSYGMAMTWLPKTYLEIVGDAKRIDRDLTGVAVRAGGELRLYGVVRNTEMGVGYHRLFLAASNDRYSEYRGYCAYTYGRCRMTADLVEYHYDHHIYKKQDALEGQISSSIRFGESLEVALSGISGTSPDMTDYLLGIVKVTWIFSAR